MTSLDVSFNAVQFVVLGYLVTMTGLAVYAGRLGDRFGKRRLLFAGLGLFALASLVCTTAPNLPVLVAGRALQGAGAALLSALALAMVVDVMPPGKAGSGLGVLSATSAVGTMIGPTAGAFLIALGGWRAIFALNVPLAIVVYVILRFTTKPLPAGQRSAETPAAGWRMPRVLKVSLAANFLVNMMMVSTLILAPFVLARAFLLSIHATGLVMGIGPLMTVLFALLAGRFADKLDAGAVTVIGLTFFAFGTLSMALLHAQFGLIAYIIPVLLIGGGWGLFQTSNNHVMLNECEPGRRGTVSGWLSLSRNLGLIFGTAMISQLFSAVTRGNVQSGEAVVNALHVVFTVGTCVIVTALALVIYVYLLRLRKPVEAA
jgi:MFS family permease